MVLVGACSFDHGVSNTDASPPDIRPDDPPMVTWSVDGMSNKGVPAAAFEWTELFNKIGLAKDPPTNLWLMQETSGSLADSIGAVTLAPLNGPTYTNAVSGWSRGAVGTLDTQANHGFQTTATGNLDGTPYLLLIYVVVVATPAAPDRSLVGIGAASDHRYVTITPASVYKGTGTGVTPTTGTVDPLAAAHPIVVKINPAQFSYVVYTDQEKLTMTWAGTSSQGGLLVIGNAIIGAASARYLYAALWKGASAEFADLDVKRMLLGLGWNVTGY